MNNIIKYIESIEREQNQNPPVQNNRDRNEFQNTLADPDQYQLDSNGQVNWEKKWLSYLSVLFDLRYVFSKEF